MLTPKNLISNANKRKKKDPDEDVDLSYQSFDEEEEIIDPYREYNPQNKKASSTPTTTSTTTTSNDQSNWFLLSYDSQTGI
jgi:hypothetical protein